MIGQKQKFKTDLIARLESMSFHEAREKILTYQLGFEAGESHDICLSWLSCKEAEIRDAREINTQSWARHAAYAAYAAAIIAAISIIITIK